MNDAPLHCCYLTHTTSYAAQQGMLHAVSLHTSAPHSVPSVGGVPVHVCADMSSSSCIGTGYSGHLWDRPMCSD